MGVAGGLEYLEAVYSLCSADWVEVIEHLQI